MAKFVFLLLLLGGCSGTDEPEVWSVTQTLGFGRLPRWSPDGSLIAFGEDRPGQAGIWVWDGQTDAVRLTSSIPHNWDYCWSPDNARIAFSSPAAPEDSLGGVWAVDLATHEAIRIWDRGRDVSWGDSGNGLCFQIENPVGGAPGIYALTIGDSLPRFIAAQGIKPQGRPGSNQIAYADGSLNARVWIGSEGVAPVAASGYGALQWDWSSDGRLLFVVTNRYASGTLRSVLWAVDGSDPARIDSLTSGAGNLSADYSGGRVVFARSSGSTWLGIWIHRNGEDVQIMPYGENPDIHPTQDQVAFNASGGGVRIMIRSQ